MIFRSSSLGYRFVLPSSGHNSKPTASWLTVIKNNEWKGCVGEKMMMDSRAWPGGHNILCPAYKIQREWTDSDQNINNPLSEHRNEMKRNTVTKSGSVHHPRMIELKIDQRRIKILLTIWVRLLKTTFTFSPIHLRQRLDWYVCLQVLLLD